MITTVFTDFRIAFFIGLILVVTIITASAFNYYIDKHVKRLITRKQIDQTSYFFLKKMISALIYIIGTAFALAQIPEMKTIGHSLLAGAGIVSLIAGLASQQALSNIMSGFLIVLFKPFKINDRITFNSQYTGIVEEINLRQVVLRDIENNRIIVPNSVISSQVIVNTDMSEPHVCKMIVIGIGYNSDIGKALSIMEEEIVKHPLHIDTRSAEDVVNNVPKVSSKVVALENSAVSLKAWAYASTASNGSTMYYDLLRSIKERFDKEGIEIPYNYQNVIIKNE